MLFSKQDQSEIKVIIQSKGFEAVKRVAEDLMRQWTSELPSANEQFLYLQQSLQRDGKLLGLSQFFKELDKISREYGNSANR